MAIASDFTLNQVVVEVQYDRGIVYLDKCGSLMLKLQDQLREPFKPVAMPNMDHGELQSIAERVVVRYGQQSTNLTQAWPPTPVRLEQLAPIVWDTVSESLNVGSRVTRCGARFWLLWKADTLEEARDRLRGAPIATICEEARTAFGDGAAQGWVILTEEAHGTVRTSLEVVETNIEKAALPADLVSVVPKFSILLDLDHSRGGPMGTSVARPFSMSASQLREFIRASWQRTKIAATTIGRLIGGEPDGHGRRDATD